MKSTDKPIAKAIMASEEARRRIKASSAKLGLSMLEYMEIISQIPPEEVDPLSIKKK